MTTKEDIAAGSPAPQRSPYPQGKTHLFFIAIDDYRNGISKLYNAVSDAKAISDCLIDNYQVNREDLVMLINEKATKKEICHQLDRYTEEITDEDNLIFLFSGHGYFHKNTKEGYWLTADSVKGEYTSFLNNGTITRYIRNIPARHIFGIVDACFSEALFQTQKSSDRLDHRYSIRSRWLLTAGRLEPVSDGAIGEQSPFAKSLLEELSHLESSHLWVSELCSRVTKGTIYNARHQTPRGEPLHDVDHLGGDFVFLRRGEELTNIIPENTPTVDPKKLPADRSKPGLHPAILPIEKFKLQLMERLSENDWRFVFAQLKAKLILDGNKIHQLMGLIRRYNDLQDQIISLTLSRREINLQQNQLYAHTNQFIRSLRESDLQH